MPSRYLASLIDYPAWAGPRYRRMDMLQRYLDGTIYDVLPHSFYEEVSSGNVYIPLRERRPSVVYNLARVVVSRSVSLLFGGKHWPKFHCTEKGVTDFLTEIDNISGLQAAMIEAATLGSLGSVAVCFQIIDGKFYYEVWNSKYCQPIFNKTRDLEDLFVLEPTMGYNLKAIGYTIDDDDLNILYFFAKRYTTAEEILYHPIKCEEYESESDLVKDTERSTTHSLGFVPGVWVKNFPSTNGIDSDCTFEPIIDLSIEIDYQLSQCGRGLKYASDPQLVIKEPFGAPSAGMNGYSEPIVRSANNALSVGKDGDAKLLEITGQGQKTVLEYVKLLRQWGLEVVRASRKDPEHSYGNMSGRAMEILDEDLISLAALGRVSYGEIGLKQLVCKMLQASAQLDLISDDPTDNSSFALRLQWGNWFDPTPTDLVQTETALDLGVKGRRLFESEARMISASSWNVGHAEPEKLEEEWPIPPEPQIVKDEKEMKTLAPPKPKGTGGDDGRDAKVQG